MSFRIGDKVGDYRIVGMVGAGGAGRVFRVEHHVTGRVEAMKVLLEGRGTETDAPAARFLREIKLQASLDHPNIASVHNAFWVKDELVMIMELVQGVSLDRVIADGRMPMGKVLRYAVQSLMALEYAHGRGITHRDIKPENIMVTPEGVIKLMDFGLAKDRNDARATETGVVVGSLYYISPEQARGLPTVDHRTDVYSFGSVLYEMTTGQRPFLHNTSFDLLQAAVMEAPRPPSELVSDIPPALDAVILRSMAKDPGERFQSARELRRTIEGIVRNPGVEIAAPVASVRSTRRAMAMRQDGRRSTVIRALLLAASLLALAYMAFQALSGGAGTAAARAVVGAPPAVESIQAGTVDRDGGFVLREIIRLDELPTALTFTRTGDMLAAGLRDGRIRTWETGSGRQIRDLSGPGREIAALTATAQHVGAIDSEGAAYVWDVSAGASPRPIDNERPARLARFSEDGRRLAVVADDGSLRVLDLQTNQSWSFPPAKGSPRALAFSPAGPMLAVSEPGRIALWGVGLTDERETLSAQGPEAEAIAFSSNALELGAGIGSQIVTWDMPTRRGARTYVLKGKVRALAHAGKQGWVAVTDGARKNELRVWRVNEGRSVKTLSLKNPAVALALSGDGERLAASTAEAEVYYWDTLPPVKNP